MHDSNLFFSLDQFAHRSLWQNDKPVWHPLTLLKDYFHQMTTFKIEVEIPEGVFLKNPELISIGKGTIIEPGTYIKGPCVIGKNSHIAHGAYIREFTLCGNECSIGHSAEVKHSILLDKATAAHFSYAGDSILGNGVNLGAGVKCANVRLDKKNIMISFKDKKFDTGLRKLGAIIGDHTQIGCNSVLNPGTLVERESLILPLSNISHGYSSKKKVCQ